MQPEARDPASVAEMLAAARGVLRTLRDLPLDRYLANEDLRHSVERKLEIMGDAARRVSESLREKHPGIPWRAIIGQRNILIHGYDAIDHVRVWRLAADHLPDAVSRLAALADELGGEEES